MFPSEPAPTAWLLVTFGVLAALSALLSRASSRFGVPLVLVFLVIGIVAGSEGIGGIAFEDYALTFRIGTAALVLILFDGGLNTPLQSVREGIRPAAVLATVGVAGTALLLAAAAVLLLGFTWTEALLLGATVSSTDAAAVFSVLRGSGLHLKRRVGTTLELESGLNDPTAVLLTIELTRGLLTGEGPAWWLLLEVPVQLAVGLALGAGIGYAGVAIMRRTRLPAGGLYAVLTLAFAFLAFGVPTLLHGSGFLAVYTAGVVLGNAPVPYRAGLLRVHDALAWLAQVAMFLLLGLLVFPSQLFAVAPTGIALALLLAVVARPLVVALCLAPFRYPLREVAYIGWVGLRGAVPIILATFPVLAQAPGGLRIFNVVAVVAIMSAIVPGGTIRWVTRRLGLAARVPPPPPAVLEITSTQMLDGEVVSFHIDRASAASGASISQLEFPAGASVMLVVRGRELVPPRGDTVFQPGDHVYVFCKPEDLPVVQLMLGQSESD